MKRAIGRAQLSIQGSTANKLEQRYAAEILRPRILCREITWFAFEPMRLKLAPNTTYTPDFGALRADGGFELHEVKQIWIDKEGGQRVGYKDDARVKVKLAAQAFPFFEFIVAAYRAPSRKHRLSSEWSYDFIHASVDGGVLL